MKSVTEMGSFHFRAITIRGGRVWEKSQDRRGGEDARSWDKPRGEKCEKESHSRTQGGSDQDKITTQLKRIFRSLLLFAQDGLIVEIMRYRERQYRKIFFLRSCLIQHQSLGQVSNFGRLQ